MSILQSLNRRRFLRLGTLAGGAVGAAGAGALLADREEADASILRPGQFDQHFLTSTAQVKQIWDFSLVEQLQGGLAAIKNAANAFKFSYNKTYFLIIDLRGSAVVAALDDAMWARYKFGAKYQIFDPASGALVSRNPFYARGATDNGALSPDDPKSIYQDATLAALVYRASHISACHDALQSQAALAVKDGRNHGLAADAVYRDFAAHLVHGAQETPSGSALIAIAQPLGFTYAKQ